MGAHRHRWFIAAVLALAFALFGASCTSPSEESVTAEAPTAEPTTGAAEPTSDVAAAATPELPPENVVEDSTPTTPTATPTAVVPDDGPSQSASDAARDGVPQMSAELTFTQRVEIWREVEVDGERWAISKLPFPSRGEGLAQQLINASIDPSSGELLHIVDGRIERAIFMPSSPPTWIVADGDLIFAGRQGDGGYPSSSIVRLDLASDEVTMLWLQASFANRGWGGEGVWNFVAPGSMPQVLPALRAAINAQGNDATAEQIAAAVEGLEAAVDGVSTYDPTSIPLLAMAEARCPSGGWNSHLLYYIDGVCIFQMTVDSGANPMVMVGTEPVAGRLVGAGSTDSTGPTYAAIVASSSPGVAVNPLIFMNMDDPADRFDTGIIGRDEGSQLLQVSFFDGGFVGTWAVDQGSRVLAFDAEAKPLTTFVSPTDRELGYPPDPYVQNAAMSPDGAHLSFIEREWPNDGSGEPGTAAALVVTLAATGSETQRVDFDLATNDFVEWVDFDGRWALVSLFRVYEGEPAGPRVPFVIDTDTGVVYPFNIDELGASTFSRTAIADNADEE